MPGLLVGLILTLAAVVAYSYYVRRQVVGLRALQTDLVDRNRRDSLRLLRIQNNLNELGLAMRDMIEGAQPYPLHAWSSQFTRIRTDLDDALSEGEASPLAAVDPTEREHLLDSLSQFWNAVDRTLALSEQGQAEEAYAQVQLSLRARQAALTTSVARLLVANNEADALAASQVQAIYSQVQRQGYWFLVATLVAISATGAYVIRANRRLFAELRSLSDGRRALAQQLIAARESTLRHVARELHDELGQVLTTMGSMLGRVSRQTPEQSPLRADLQEVAEIAQSALTNVRSLSQALHPSILEALGLQSTLEWYLGTTARQMGLEIDLQVTGAPVDIDSRASIHVYRVLQEALNNVIRHSGSTRAAVRLIYETDNVTLEVEDYGTGIPADRAGRRGIGLVAMSERAALVGGTLNIERPLQGGTRVRLRVPLPGPEQEPA